MSNSQHPLLIVHPKYFSLELHVKELPPITRLNCIGACPPKVTHCVLAGLKWISHLLPNSLQTKMLAINVSILNLTVARLQQFPSPQMTDNKPSFTRKPHVVIFCQSPFAANAVPKLVAMATSLRPSMSGMSSLDSLTSKTHP